MFLYLENTYIIFTNNLLLDNPDLVRGSNGQKFFNIGYLNLASCLTRTFIQPVKDLTGKMWIQKFSKTTVILFYYLEIFPQNSLFSSGKLLSMRVFCLPWQKFTKGPMELGAISNFHHWRPHGRI